MYFPYRRGRAAQCEVVSQVTDDGIGLPTMQADGGRVLADMRERVILFGAEFSAGPLPAAGYEAIAGVRRRDPDVVLMDVRMPVMDGLKSATHLARADSRAES